MKNNIDIWLERLSSLYISQMRQAAANEGIQTVHLEILQYLSICNEYSNTAQALSEYLGQTKGSISQSLKVMEKIGHISREASIEDKRVYKLYITAEGGKSLNRMSKEMVSISDSGSKSEDMIKTLLKNWQETNQQNGFGQCITCRYNQKKKNNQFKCGLTGLDLVKSQTLKICREHEFKMNKR